MRLRPSARRRAERGPSDRWDLLGVQPVGDPRAEPAHPPGEDRSVAADVLPKTATTAGASRRGAGETNVTAAADPSASAQPCRRNCHRMACRCDSRGPTAGLTSNASGPSGAGVGAEGYFFRRVTI